MKGGGASRILDGWHFIPGDVVKNESHGEYRFTVLSPTPSSSATFFCVYPCSRSDSRSVETAGKGT
jgi:hypothetical protein